MPLLTLDSKDRLSYEDTDSFTISFASPLVLYSREGNPDPLAKKWRWVMACTRVDTWYSLANVDAPRYDNARLDISNDGGATFDVITVPLGTYNLTALNEEINRQVILNGGANGSVVFTPNYATNKATLVLAAGYQVDMSVSNFYLLMGFSAAQVAAPITTTTEGANIANVNNSVNTWLIRCDLVSPNDSYDSSLGSDILYSTSPSVPPASAITVEPAQPIFVACREVEQVPTIRVYLTDQLGRRIDLRGEPLTVRILLKKERVL